MFNRNRIQDNAALDAAHDDAVRLATTPGQARLGVTSNRTPIISSVAASETTPDANGNTIEAALLWDVDRWDRAHWG